MTNLINGPIAITAENQTRKLKGKMEPIEWKRPARLHAVADSVTPPGLATYWQWTVWHWQTDNYLVRYGG